MEKCDVFWNLITKKGKNATQAAKKICDVYGHDVVSVLVVWSWFKRFQSRYFDVKDVHRFGRPITGKFDEVIEKIEQDKVRSKLNETFSK